MTHGTDPVSRRSVLRKGGLTVTAVAVGVPAVTGTVAAEEVVTMIVDVPPTISSNQSGQVVTAIYPGGDENPEDLEDFVSPGNQLGFKLGPDDGDIDFRTEDVEDHADSVRSRLVYNGRHRAYVMGVFFDSSTAGDWFTPDDDRAKLSAVERNGNGELVDMIAWGDDGVRIR